MLSWQLQVERFDAQDLRHCIYHFVIGVHYQSITESLPYGTVAGNK